MVRLNVNGKAHEVEADLETPLLWILRDYLGLTGTKYGCGIAQCGACTVHLNGQVVRSCRLGLGQVSKFDIVTIEGLAGEEEAHPVQIAWIEEDVPQCGYCQSGQIMAAAALLRDKSQPTDEDIDRAMTNICRCGAYPGIRRAIHRAARRIGGDQWS